MATGRRYLLRLSSAHIGLPLRTIKYLLIVNPSQKVMDRADFLRRFVANQNSLTLSAGLFMGLLGQIMLFGTQSRFNQINVFDRQLKLLIVARHHFIPGFARLKPELRSVMRAARLDIV